MTETIIIEGDAETVLTPGSPQVTITEGAQGAAGPAGPPGPQGPQGPPGSGGGGGGGTFTWDQATPSVLWTVVHNLGFFPNVTVVDSAKSTVVGHVTYIDSNTLQIEFTAAFAGQAFLS